MWAEEQAPLRRGRLLMVLAAAEHAGITPLSVVELHAFAYLANVLSPVWDLAPQKRSVLHRQGGPYYPEMQEDIDALIGRGLLGIQGLRHTKDSNGRWRLEGNFFVAEVEAVRSIVSSLTEFTDETRLFKFYRELAFAISNLSRSERASAFSEDATYKVDVGEEVIIDFAEWQQANYSENAARSFDQLMPDHRSATPAQKLHLYVHHLKRRLKHVV
jgi:hypothetical protein